MPATFSHLLAPGAIGGLALRNRILMAPMGDSLANPDGTVSDAQLAYFEARARGGAALLLIGSVAVAYPDGCVDERQVAASRDTDVDGLRALADRVHAHGAALAAQLTYNGALARLDIARGRPMLVPAVPARPHPDALTMMLTDAEMAGFAAPYASPTAKVDYRVATDEDLAGVLDHFATAADRCRRAGVDGVELHAGHGYLVDEFLSPASNGRTDAWGGDTAARARLLIEVIRSVRARVGDGYPLWMRINALEHHKAHGETFAEQLEVIRLAVAAGLDAVHVTAYASMDVATGPTDSYAPHRVGDLADYAAQVKRAVPVPVVTFGRFEPDEAEQVLADGRADFVAMGRKLLADPDLPNKLARGEVERIRPCLYQYRCIGNIFVNQSLACVANAATGREHEATLPSPRRSQRVLVVGGGAAGLETARVLAGQGHAVELRERSSTLGGILAEVAGADAVLDRQLAWLVGEIERTDVVLRLGVTVEHADVAAGGFDAVVLATGPTWTRPTVTGADRVLTPAALRGWWTTDGGAPTTVAILGGGKPGLTLAAAARVRGHDVALVEPTPVFGRELGLPGRWRLVADAAAAGVRLLGSAPVREVGADTVTVDGPEGTVVIPAAVVVTATREAGAAVLAIAMDATGIPVTVAGDAADPRGFEGITRDAETIARSLAV
ncbi:MAG: oxidoreductase [Acidimicrobiia bacterium]